MECPACDGLGCAACDQGTIEIDCCPLDLITPDTWDVIDLAGFYEKGLAPSAGGVMDQAENFLRACRMIWNEEKKYKVKHGYPN